MFSTPFCQEVPQFFLSRLIFGPTYECGPHVLLGNLPLPLLVTVVIASAVTTLFVALYLTEGDGEGSRPFETSVTPEEDARNFQTTAQPVQHTFEAQGRGKGDLVTLTAKRKAGLGERVTAVNLMPGIAEKA
eukprot:g13800.t1